MGMDVYGVAPENERGEYFRANVWTWRPLAEYVLEVASEKIIGIEDVSWHFNDGDGLGADDSVMLAALLDLELASGRTADFMKLREETISSLPDETCDWCGGTGIRTDDIGKKMGQPARAVPEDAKDERGRPHPRAGQTGWCNCCNGCGYNSPFESHYNFEAQNVADFSEFLRNCGGFKIW